MYQNHTGGKRPELKSEQTMMVASPEESNRYDSESERATQDDTEYSKLAMSSTSENPEQEEEEEVTKDETRQSPPVTRRFSFIRKVSVWKKFSRSISTEQYNNDEKADFRGPFAHLRKTLDYSYHCRYRKERQWLQDSIIEDILEADLPADLSMCSTPTEPWLIFAVGVRGVGKKYIVRELVKVGRLPLLSFVHIDPNDIRRRLPEFDTYSNQNPFLVDDLTKKESGFIAEVLLLAALQAQRNVIFHGSMKHTEWHVNLVQKLRKKYPQLRFGLLHVTAPTEAILDRARHKYQDTGGDITRDNVNNKMMRIEDAVEIAKPAFDFSCTIHNGMGQPQLIDMEWEQFETTFLQTCAWSPGMRGHVREVSSEESSECRRIAIQRVETEHKPFSVYLSSEENNASDDMNFYGKFSHIRETLDYKYHSNYTFERQNLQDAIVSDMIDSAIITDVDGKIGSVPTEPWIVFTAGAMGAGKSHTMSVLVEKGWFPLQAFVIVDPDEIRRLLPEYHMYIDDNPELAGELTSKEAGFIAEILTLAALQAGKNVLQDGSLRDANWYQQYFSRLRKEFPSVRQAILHITAPREAVFRRAESRAESTGRIVPRALLEATLEQVPRSVNILAPLVDYYAELNNADEVQLIKPEGSTWEQFRDVWNQ